MVKEICRDNDIGEGVCHACSDEHQYGKAKSTALTIQMNFRNVVLTDDIVIADCGHIGTLIGGSLTVTAEGRKIIRIGDAFTGDYEGVMITGSPDSFCE